MKRKGNDGDGGDDYRAGRCRAKYVRIGGEQEFHGEQDGVIRLMI